MVKIGQARSGTPKPPRVEQVPFAAPGGAGVALEVFTIDELRARVPGRRLQAPHRIEFHQWILVTRGRHAHEIDFTTHAARAGSWVIVHPGQVQSFSTDSAWDGWAVILHPQLLAPRARPGNAQARDERLALATLNNHLVLDDAEYRASLGAVRQMARDAQTIAPGPDVQRLLRHQFQALALRLQLSQRRQAAPLQGSAAALLRFAGLRDLVEQNFHRWHQLGRYAQHMGCTERSLTRAALEVTGRPAKAYVSGRIVLEARRLLVHTSAPVATIAADLGFAEASNFVKFFKREAGCLPGEFRRRHV